jgi:hypothetical protein
MWLIYYVKSRFGKNFLKPRQGTFSETLSSFSSQDAFRAAGRWTVSSCSMAVVAKRRA